MISTTRYGREKCPQRAQRRSTTLAAAWLVALGAVTVGVQAAELRDPDRRVDTPTGLYANSTTRAPAVFMDGGRIYAVWVDSKNFLGLDPYFNQSVNQGGTWREGDQRLNTNYSAGSVLGDSSAGFVRSAGDNFVFVFYLSNDGTLADGTMVASADRGETWGAPKDYVINDSRRYDWSLVVAPGGKAWATYADDREGGGSGLQSVFTRSTRDGNVTLQAEQRINILNDPPAQSIYYERASQTAVCADSANHVYWAFRDARHPTDFSKTQAFPGRIMLRYSNDSGVTLLPAAPPATTELRLDTGDTGGVGGLGTESYKPSIACRSDNVVVVAWEDNRNGNADIYLNLSKVNPLSFLTPDRRVDVSSPAATNQRAPKVAISAGNPLKIYVAWEDDRNAGKDIYFSVSTDEGLTWSTPSLTNSGVTPGAFPVQSWDLAASGDHVVVSWIDNRNGSATPRRDVFAVESFDGGVTFSAPQRLDLGTGPGVADSIDLRTSVSGDAFAAIYADFRSDGTHADVLAGGKGQAFDTQDADADGLSISKDNCPNYPNPTQRDRDFDGRGDLCESFLTDPFNDIDGDGIDPSTDVCPFANDSLQEDADLDGIGDACDFCKTTSEQVSRDLDRDGTGDACDTDVDGDGIVNTSDNDDDNDGKSDAQDNCSWVPNARQLDDDLDGTGNECDTNDNIVQNVLIKRQAATTQRMFWDKEVGAQYYNVYFGLADRLRNGDKGYCYRPAVKTYAALLTDRPDPGKIFWYLATSFNGTEGSAGKASNGTPRQVPSPCNENTADDWDQDGAVNRNDNCRFDANASQADADIDGLGDVCDAFSKDPYNDSLDSDGVGTDTDNCPFVSNPGQADADGDGVGDACDDCPANFDPLQQDANKNHLGDACDPDTDGDGIPNAIDPDLDNDGIANAVDNCPFTENERQLDRDSDGTGDACDTSDTEIGGVTVAKGANPRVSWTREVGATGYSIYTDLVSNLTAGGTYGTCYKANTALPFADLTDGNPTLGQARYYLVTGFFGGVQGTAGKDSQGNERAVPAGCQ